MKIKKQQERAVIHKRDIRKTVIFLQKTSFLLCLTLLFISLAACPSQRKNFSNELRLFAAASTTSSMRDLISLFSKERKILVKTHFASSSLLARQIEAGAKADIFLSANAMWMTYLERRNLISAKDKFVLMRNSLVLAVPKGGRIRGFSSLYLFAKDFQGKFAVPNTSHVPLGIYAGQALKRAHVWRLLKGHLVETQNALTNLRILESGAVEAAIMYKTDALSSKKVRLLYEIPPILHEPIEYFIAPIRRASSRALDFIEFLKKHPEFFERHGFSSLLKRR